MKAILAVIVLGVFSSVSAFRGLPVKSYVRSVKTLQSSLQDLPQISQDDAIFMPFSDDLIVDKAMTSDSNDMQVAAALMTAMMTVFLPLEDAMAANGEYGIFENRAASMMHPLTMSALFATSVYSAYLGLQWRRLRGIGDEIKQLSSQLPLLPASGQAKFPLSETMSAITNEIGTLQSATETPTTTGASRLALLQKDLDILKGSMGLDAQYQQLSTTRKELLAANLRDKHWTTGSWLLGAGVTVSMLGAFNTYMRAGKLFPGPHLYAGMAITGLWAAAAALVPAMQKGNEAARLGHIVFNSANVLLFAWQMVTGFDIAIKVWEKTHW